MRKICISILLISFLFSGCSKTAKTIVEDTQDNFQIEYYFSQEKQKPDEQLIKVINDTKNTLDIAIYSLTKDNIVNSIVDAQKRGVTVRIITDNIQASNKTEISQLTKIKNVNIPIKLNAHSGLMHMKVTIADKSIVTTGSYNYTNNATDENDENLMIIHDTKIANDYSSEFDKMWSNHLKFKDLK